MPNTIKKNNNNIKNKLFKFATWTYECSKLSDIIRVKAGTALTDIFLKIKLIAGGSLSLSLVKSTRLLALTLKDIQKRQGIKGLTLYLKSVSVALQQSVSGYIIKDFTAVGPRPSRTSSGLPRIIPSGHRLIIRNKGPGYLILIRYYLSLFYLYRVLEFKGKVKLNTITDPPKLFDIQRFKNYMENFTNLFLKGRQDHLDFMTSNSKFFPIFKSSPFTGFIVYNPLKDVKLYNLFSTHCIALMHSVRFISQSHLLPIIQDLSLFYFKKLKDFIHMNLGTHETDTITKELGFSLNPYKDQALGKLSLKKEAAGKVRVFAMVDPITQWLLAPLHKFLFSILRKIPMDGTFNQLKPVYRLLRKPGIKKYFSLDLSAATDRLPVSIQQELLNVMFKSFIPNFGDK